ncbi:MAG: hypothetical protein ACKV0T_30840 [Planctomycetales bacterium]
MNVRGTSWLAGALLATPLALGAGWLWHLDRPVEYLSRARLTLSASALDGDGPVAAVVEETLWSPQQVSLLVARLREQEVSLPLDSPFDSEVEVLARRLELSYSRNGDDHDIEMRYRSPDPQMAAPVLAAVIEICQASFERAAEPAQPAPDRQREQLQWRQAVERQQAVIDTLSEEWERFNDSSSGASHERLPALEEALARAETLRSDAEFILASTRQKLSSGMSPESIAQSLPEGELAKSTRKLLTAARSRLDMSEQESELQQASRVYGKNHPRMVALRKGIDRLQQQLAQVDLDLGEEAHSASPADLLVHALDAQGQLAAEAERDCRKQLDEVLASETQRQRLDEESTDARQELAFLQNEQAQSLAEINPVHSGERHSAVRVVEPPVLSEDPIVPSPLTPLLWSAAAGLVISIGMWRQARQFRQFRDAAPASPSRPQSSARERFQSQEELNLARLKRLSAPQA